MFVKTDICLSSLNFSEKFFEEKNSYQFNSPTLNKFISHFQQKFNCSVIKTETFVSRGTFWKKVLFLKKWCIQYLVFDFQKCFWVFGKLFPQGDQNWIAQVHRHNLRKQMYFQRKLPFNFIRVRPKIFWTFVARKIVMVVRMDF